MHKLNASPAFDSSCIILLKHLMPDKCVSCMYCRPGIKASTCTCAHVHVYMCKLNSCTYNVGSNAHVHVHVKQRQKQRPNTVSTATYLQCTYTRRQGFI